MESAKCPYCEKEIKEIKYSAEYSESGYSRGYVDFELDCHDICETESSHFDEDNCEYECPECGHGLNREEIGELEEYIEKKPAKKELLGLNK